MSDHDLAFITKGFDNGQHILIVLLAGIFAEHRNGIAATEHQRIELVFMPFQVGDHIIRNQLDT